MADISTSNQLLVRSNQINVFINSSNKENNKGMDGQNKLTAYTIPIVSLSLPTDTRSYCLRRYKSFYF